MHAYFWVLEIYLLKHVNKWGKLQLSTTKKMSAVEGWGHWLFHTHPENITLQAADTEWPYIPASVTVHSWLYTSQAPTILTIWNSNWGYNFLLFSWSLFREMIGNPFLGPTGLQLLFCHLRFPFHPTALLLWSVKVVKRCSLCNRIWQEWHFLFYLPWLLFLLSRAALACGTFYMNTCSHQFSILLCLEYKLKCLSKTFVSSLSFWMLQLVALVQHVRASSSFIFSIWRDRILLRLRAQTLGKGLG